MLLFSRYFLEHNMYLYTIIYVYVGCEDVKIANLWRGFGNVSKLCNTLRYTTTHDNALQHTLKRRHIRNSDALSETLWHSDWNIEIHVHCNTVYWSACVFTQHAAAHRNTLQHTVKHCDTPHHCATHYHNIALTLQYTYSLDTLAPPHTQAGWRGKGCFLYLCRMLSISVYIWIE